VSRHLQLHTEDAQKIAALYVGFFFRRRTKRA